MHLLIAGSVRVSDGNIEYVVSEHETKEEAKEAWKEDGFKVLKVAEVKMHVMGGSVPGAVIRALAGTPDGAEALSRLLKAAVENLKPEEECDLAV